MLDVSYPKTRVYFLLIPLPVNLTVPLPVNLMHGSLPVHSPVFFLVFYVANALMLMRMCSGQSVRLFISWQSAPDQFIRILHTSSSPASSQLSSVGENTIAGVISMSFAASSALVTASGDRNKSYSGNSRAQYNPISYIKQHGTPYTVPLYAQMLIVVKFLKLFNDY